MPDSFRSLNIKSLADVDAANVSYGNECVVIRGIVSPSGQGGWLREDFGVHFFEFAAWRRPERPINKRTLTILRPVPRESNYLAEFPEHTIHRISVLLSADETRAVFDKLLSLDEPDPELVAFGEELRKPVIISTKTFGNLVLDRRFNWFEGEAEWNGKVIEVHFHPDATQSIDAALKTAEALWANQTEWNRGVADFAVENLPAQ